MENAVEAIKMAGGVIIFVLALSISINAFTNTRQGVDNLVLYSDREFLSTYVKQNKGTKRIVGTESIVPTIYRAYKENIKINFKFLEEDVKNDPTKEPLYTKKTTTGDKKICYIDLDEEIHGDANLREFFLKNLLYGNGVKGKMYSNSDYDKYYNSMSDIKFNDAGIYKRLTTGDLKGDYEESLGVHYPTESQGTSDKSTINKTEKKVITYFEHVGLASKTESTAIVDIRTTGKSLKYINELLRSHEFNPIYGYFFEMFCTGETLPNMPLYSCEINSVYSSLSNIQTRALSSQGVLLEMFFSIHEEPKTIGYDVSQKGQPYPVFSDSADEEDCYIKNVNQVVSIRKKLLSRYTDAFIKTHLYEYANDCMKQLALPTLARFYINPEKDYLEALTYFQVRNEYSSQMQPFVEHLSILGILHRKKGLSWHRGSMAWTLPKWLYKIHYKK